MSQQVVEEIRGVPGQAGRSPGWKVAVIANLQGAGEPPGSSKAKASAKKPPDADAEYDKPCTVVAIRQVIESAGHRATFLPADRNLPFALADYAPDICFNIAEGLHGDGREAQVPALLELMGIPYTASRVVAHAISLEKTLTKRIWRDMGLPVTPFQEFVSGDERLRPGYKFPLFVKPTREGTGMGIDPRAVVHAESELHNRVGWIIATYHQLSTACARRSTIKTGIIVFRLRRSRVTSRSPRACMVFAPRCGRLGMPARWATIARRRSKPGSRSGCGGWPGVRTAPSAPWTSRGWISAWTPGASRACWRSTRCPAWPRITAISVSWQGTAGWLTAT
jgi:hypothetical protein